jgi:O-acetyl-ADP-ribose deacetylase (regulator of RNase III)
MNRLEVKKGDITRLHIDAIVNAANRSLRGGGGVDGAIHRAAGPELLAECILLNGCETGEAKLTKGYNLPASFVIHTVGPVWHGGNSGESGLLSSAYYQSLLIAAEKKFKKLAFPCISTGVYGYPKKEAAIIAIKTTISFLFEHEYPAKVIFICFDEESYTVYLKLTE